MSLWSEWTICSHSCGKGFTERFRNCIEPQYGGKNCNETTKDKKDCYLKPCPGSRL